MALPEVPGRECPEKDDFTRPAGIKLENRREERLVIGLETVILPIPEKQ